MKKVVMGVMVAIMAVSIGLSSAEAKRMGSGGSVGKQSQSVNQSALRSRRNRRRQCNRPRLHDPQLRRQRPRPSPPAHGRACWAAHCWAWD
jgi:hypothetical protein